MANEREETDNSHGEISTGLEASSLEDNKENVRFFAATDKTMIKTVSVDKTGVISEQESEKIGKKDTREGFAPEVIVLNEKTSNIVIDDSSELRRVGKNTKSEETNRIIELSDDKSKMDLRRELTLEEGCQEITFVNKPAREPARRSKNSVVEGTSADEILSRLPAGTLLIKQSGTGSAIPAANAKISAREDSDYVHDSSKDSTGTNSSGSSSAASYRAPVKVKRMQHRNARNKKIVEVRRNPARNKKKKPMDEDFTRPRQRLMAVKRKSSFLGDGGSTRRRGKTAPTPYMNTRSVTRKMYTVGATYQAPTIHDAIEWKDWPSHGMHERPIWHPQVGLAYEYNRRSFLTLDGRTYREIIDEPFIEVVSVDPRAEPTETCRRKRKFENRRCKDSLGSPKPLETIKEERKFSKEENSFQACMHKSFHSVLAYCAQIVNPTYESCLSHANRNKIHQVQPVEKAAPETKTETSPSDATSKSLTSEVPKAPKSDLPDVPTGSNHELPKCLVIPRKTIHFTNVRNIQGNILQEVFNRSSKNTLIFLKPTDPPGKAAEKIAAALKSSVPIKTANSPMKTCKEKPEKTTTDLNLTKLDDNAISDEALMEISSIYNNLLPTDETETGNQPNPNQTQNKPIKPAHCLPRPVTALVATKFPRKSCNPPSTENSSSNRGSYSGFPLDDFSGAKTPEIPLRLHSYSNQASEIAKILAEYNHKAAQNSTMRNCYASCLTVQGEKTGKVNQQRCVSANEDAKRMKLSVGADGTNNSKLRKIEDKQNLEFPRAFSNVPEGKAVPEVVASPEEKVDDAEKNEACHDVGQAIDLTTAKIKNELVILEKPLESKKWLEELIEDTAILYCAATGAHQADVAEYINQLDSAQSIQWLGS